MLVLAEIFDSDWAASHSSQKDESFIADIELLR